MSIYALSPLLYANDGLVTSPGSARIQGVFDALAGLFERVGLHTKEENTASMACQPCHTPHVWSTESYTW